MKNMMLTNEQKESLVAEFRTKLESINTMNGSVKFEHDLKVQDDRENACLYFEPLAISKLMLLVHAFDTEVGFAGTAVRGEYDNEYIVKDILVHSQTVTGGSFRSDAKEYEEWMEGLDDETFGELRFHGHSHCRCACVPSNLDEEMQESIAKQLTGDMFYIFLIVNKSGDFWFKIYDRKTNTIYEKGEVDLDFDTGWDLLEFLEDAKEIAKPTYTATTYAKPAAKSVNNSVIEIVDDTDDDSPYAFDYFGEKSRKRWSYR